MAEEGHKVTLNIYDVSKGHARQLSTIFLGKAIEAIWHTGIIVYGNEYYFGAGRSIEHSSAGSMPHGTPLHVVNLGVTHVNKDVFEMYLQEISSRYTAESYSFLSCNCNHFSNEVSQFLVGSTIPQYILDLPDQVLASPMGALMLRMIQNLETTFRSGGAIPQAPQISSSKQGAGIAGDPLGEDRNNVQDEISKEVASIMATGTVRASEAAILATTRVMQRFAQPVESK